MASADRGGRGLDPGHIQAVCALAPDGRGGHEARADVVAAGVRVAVRSRRAAGDAAAALIRVGYQPIPAAGGGRGRALLVTGWSPAGLDARLTALRAVLHQLECGPAVTASAAITQIRRAAARTPTAGQQAAVISWRAPGGAPGRSPAQASTLPATRPSSLPTWPTRSGSAPPAPPRPRSMT